MPPPLCRFETGDTRVWTVAELKYIAEIEEAFITGGVDVSIVGLLSGRIDLVYNWSVDGDIFSVTQSPVTQLMFNDSSSIQNISVVVYNLGKSSSHFSCSSVTPINFRLLI